MMSEEWRQDDKWVTADDKDETDGWVYGRDGDAVCEAHGNLGLLNNRVITARERAERIAKLPELEQRNTQLAHDLTRVTDERDALADSLAEIWLNHAVDSGCSPSSITAKAIDRALGVAGSDHQSIAEVAMDRLQERVARERRIIDEREAALALLREMVGVFHLDAEGDENLIVAEDWYVLNPEAAAVLKRVRDYLAGSISR